MSIDPVLNRLLLMALGESEQASFENSLGLSDAKDETSKYQYEATTRRSYGGTEEEKFSGSVDLI